MPWGPCDRAWGGQADARKPSFASCYHRLRLVMWRNATSYQYLLLTSYSLSLYSTAAIQKKNHCEIGTRRCASHRWLGKWPELAFRWSADVAKFYQIYQILHQILSDFTSDFIRFYISRCCKIRFFIRIVTCQTDLLENMESSWCQYVYPFLKKIWKFGTKSEGYQRELKHFARFFMITHLALLEI